MWSFQLTVLCPGRHHMHGIAFESVAHHPVTAVIRTSGVSPTAAGREVTVQIRRGADFRVA